MGLQFIVGSSGAGKSHDIYQDVIRRSMEEPHRRFLVIVPEQFTMQTQKNLVSMHPRKGILNIDVLSFQRLAYRIFEEVGQDLSPLLEETGKSLVLQKIAQEQGQKLKILGTNLNKPGAVEQMKSLISELMQYQVRETELEQWQSLSGDKLLLEYKLRDITLIYREFRRFLAERYVTAEEILDVLCQRIDQSEWIRGCDVVLDGFTGFTPVQNQVVRELLRLCRRVCVTVTLDRREDPFGKTLPHHLFYMSKKMIRQVTELAKEAGAELEPFYWSVHHSKSRFSEKKSLLFLEQNLFRYYAGQYPDEPEEIQIRAAENPREELEDIGRQIHALVRENKCSYRDVAVITGDLPGYGRYARQIFEELEIPYFIDEKHSLLLNPFVEYLRAAIDVAVKDFSADSVFRYLRCGLSDLTLDETDLLENYVLALGIRGNKRYQEHWIRVYPGMDPAQIEEINRIRICFLDEIKEFADQIRKPGATVLERTTALYLFIQKNRIQKKLKEQELAFGERNRKAMEKEYAQIYKIVIELLDKIVEVLGPEEMSSGRYQQILEAGLSEAQVGIIPPSAEQVVIGDMERTRLKDIRYLFLAGVNDGIIPRPVGNGGILSEADREFLEGCEANLAPGGTLTMYMQKFYLYLMLTRPSCGLILSYSSNSAKGEAVKPSYLIHTLQKIFPKLMIQKVESRSMDIRNVETVHEGWKLWMNGLNLWKDQKFSVQEEENQWRELCRWYKKNPEFEQEMNQLIEAGFYKNRENRLTSGVAKALYGQVLQNSASRLEQYAACAFAHFLQYGLGIQERQVYEFHAADMGSIIHMALEKFSLTLNKKGLHWADLSDECREACIDESIQEITADYGNTILQSSRRNAYMIERLRRILRRTVWALQEQIRAGAFEPGGFEVSFAMEDRLEAINISLSEQEKIRLRGRIDRVDLCETEDRIYVKVIDYKSGNTSLDLVALYYGLQLQLAVYLNAAVELEQKKNPGKEVEPAGIFYYQVKDPMTEGDIQEEEKKIRDKILKELRMNGLVRQEDEVIHLLDQTLDPVMHPTSSVIPISYNKNGSLSRYSKAVSGEQFQVLRAYADRKVREIGREILDGEIRIEPYLLGNKDACSYCIYHSVCGFDERIPGFTHRQLKDLDTKNCLDEMKKRMQEDEV